MGAACAREMARRGYALALLARSEDVNALATELGAVAVTGSVAAEQDLRTLVKALARYGRIDAVVNNTGHAPKGELLDLTDEAWQAGFDLLYLNVVRVARMVTPALIARKAGAIVNISSFGAVEPSLRFPVSSAMRAALGAYAKLDSQRYAGSGLRMNNVLPGFIDSCSGSSTTRRSTPRRWKRNCSRTTRGLARAVLESKKQKVDVSAFTLVIKYAKDKTGKRTGSETYSAYLGELKWVEPFTTGKGQALRLEIHTGPCAKHKHNCVFICVSPQPEAAEVWKKLREIRDGCTVP
jgi:NAD(P)-dependent dehydrogenase (short-subunit alcohol dehydrogenase family)